MHYLLTDLLCNYCLICAANKGVPFKLFRNWFSFTACTRRLWSTFPSAEHCGEFKDWLFVIFPSKKGCSGCVFFRAALKFGWRVHFCAPAWIAKIKRLIKSRKLKDGRKKFQMKKMVVEVNFYLYLMHFCLPSYSVPESWHIFIQ